jgi:branched-subunit amino acid ABC-type transport system permease component
MLELINFYLIPALVLGCIYALGAIGISLLYSILRFAHFAHGDMMTIGAYIAFGMILGVELVVFAYADPDVTVSFLAKLVSMLPFSLVLAILAGMFLEKRGFGPFTYWRTLFTIVGTVALAFPLVWALDLMTPLAADEDFELDAEFKVLAVLPFAVVLAVYMARLLDRLFYKPFRSSKPIIMVIASFGVALILRSLVQMFFGVEDESYAVGYIARPLEIFQPLRIIERHLYIFGMTVILMLALHYLLTRTRTGKAMRAMSDDADLARVTGINTEQVVMWTWIVGAGLAAIAGVLLGMDAPIKPVMGWDMLLPIFAAAILGGLGSPYGAIIGGLVIGGMEELSTFHWWLSDEPLIPGAYKTAIAFGVMVIMLIFRPQGLFRGKVL